MLNEVVQLTGPSYLLHAPKFWWWMCKANQFSFFVYTTHFFKGQSKVVKPLSQVKYLSKGIYQNYIDYTFYSDLILTLLLYYLYVLFFYLHINFFKSLKNNIF